MITIASIQQAVADAFGIPDERLFSHGKSGSHEEFEGRFAFRAVARELTGKTTMELARDLNCDHSTIVFSTIRDRELSQVCPAYRGRRALVVRMILNQDGSGPMHQEIGVYL